MILRLLLYQQKTDSSKVKFLGLNELLFYEKKSQGVRNLIECTAQHSKRKGKNIIAFATMRIHSILQFSLSFGILVK